MLNLMANRQFSAPYRKHTIGIEEVLKIAARIRRMRVHAMQIRISVDDKDDAKTTSTFLSQKECEDVPSPRTGNSAAAFGED